MVALKMWACLTETDFIKNQCFEVPSKIKRTEAPGLAVGGRRDLDFKCNRYGKQGTSENRKYLFIFYGVCAWDFDRFRF